MQIFAPESGCSDDDFLGSRKFHVKTVRILLKKVKIFFDRFFDVKFEFD